MSSVVSRRRSALDAWIESARPCTLALGVLSSAGMAEVFLRALPTFSANAYQIHSFQRHGAFEGLACFRSFGPNAVDLVKRPGATSARFIAAVVICVAVRYDRPKGRALHRLVLPNV